MAADFAFLKRNPGIALPVCDVANRACIRYLARKREPSLPRVRAYGIYLHPLISYFPAARSWKAYSVAFLPIGIITDAITAGSRELT